MVQTPPAPRFADRALAERLEGTVAVDMRRFARAARGLFPDSGAESIDLAGGVACYAGPGSPLNACFGVGFARPVSDDDIAALEEFYLGHETRPVVGVCPLADPSLLSTLAARQWVASGFENVLTVPLALGAPTGALGPAAVGVDGAPAAATPSPEGGTDGSIEIRVAETPDELATWAELVAEGFAAPAAPTDAERQLGRIAVSRGNGTALLAYVEGVPAGTGEVHVESGVAWLTADTTLPRFRRRGVQRSLQHARIRLAFEAGCDIAATESFPGSASQRNMERLGFRLAYTRVELTGPRLKGERA